MPTNTSPEQLTLDDPKQWPYELRNALNEEHRAIGDNNACDYRPTSKAEIDRATERMVTRFNRWRELRDSLSQEEIARCMRYWDETRRKNCWGLNSDLVEDKVAGQWVLCPRWAAVLDEVRRLREVLA